MMFILKISVLFFFLVVKEMNGLEFGHRIEDIIPEKYDYLIPPQIENEPVNVNVTFRELTIISVNEEDQTLMASAFLRQAWYDDRLKFPKWTNNSFHIVDVNWLAFIWKPHVYFVNSIDGKMENIIDKNIFFGIAETKKIFYHCKVILKVICEMELQNFPHDKQECSIKIASTIYNKDEVKLQWGKNFWTGKPATSLQQFNIVGHYINSCITQINASCLAYTIHLERRCGYHVINVYIPTVLIVIMSMMTFWIPYDAVPARITLGVTSLLTIITKQYQASMPNVSYVVALNVWLSCCIGFVFLSLMEYAIVITWSTKMQNNTSKFKINNDVVAPIILCKANEKWIEKKKLKSSNVNDFKAKRLDYMSRIAFPILFVLFCIIYWRFYAA